MGKSLPNADHAIISKEKIQGYLLNPAHPVGGSKARFFLKFGFTGERWEELAQALRRLACTQPVAEQVTTVFGARFVIDGPLPTPDERCPLVRTVWFIEGWKKSLRSIPHFVTAYPIRIPLEVKK